MLILKFNITLKPLSVNQAWKGRRFKTDKYDEFIKDALLLMPAQKIIDFEKLHVNIVFGFSNRSADIDNPIKPILDIIKKKYNIDDRYIYSLGVTKEIVEKGKEFICCEIRKL